MNLTLNIIHIIVSLALAILILLTVKGSSLRSNQQTPQTKRGAEKIAFYTLISLTIIFAVLSIARLYFF